MRSTPDTDSQKTTTDRRMNGARSRAVAESGTFRSSAEKSADAAEPQTDRREFERRGIALSMVDALSDILEWESSQRAS